MSFRAPRRERGRRVMSVRPGVRAAQRNRGALGGCGARDPNSCLPLRASPVRVTLLGVALALAVTLDSGLGNQGVTVPFVGCPENIHGEATPPPKGAPKIVRIDAATARQIAYYAGENGPAVFAPRGWHCHPCAGAAA